MLNYDYYKNLPKGTQRFVDFMEERSGSFYTKLFEAMLVADVDNLNKLKKVYKEESEAVYNYKNISSWWEDICKKLFK